MSPGSEIGVAKASEIPTALDLLLERVPEPEAIGQRQRWEQAIATGELSTAGIFVAREPERLIGALWLQPQAGAYALLIPPEVAAEQPAATAQALLSAALQAAQQAGANLVQSLLPVADAPAAAFLEQHGFWHLADLVYLVSLAPSYPQQEPCGEWRTRGYSAADEPALLALLERTYEGSQDCPRLAGLRTTQDALAGYAAVGESGARHWHLVEAHGLPVGCLLMADHADDGPRELVYMGLVPEARGRGWGAALSRFAQWTAGQAGKELLVLAVDAANAPAIEAYRQAGFTRWEERRVFVRNLGSSSLPRS